MELFLILSFILFVVIVAAFAFGPKVLRWFFNTLDEWLEIIDSAKDEK